MKTILALLSTTSLAIATELPEPVSDADYHQPGAAPSAEKVELGRQLFFDKILSGNRNISCATCHHPKHGSSDGLALPFGEGPRGLGPERSPGTRKAEAVHTRIPRNSPALFNLGAKEFTRLFHDGRVEADPQGHYEGGFITPAKWKLPEGLDSVLAAQAMFPVASPDEMAGQKGENPVGDAASLNNAAGPGGVWDLLAARLRDVPEYVDLFAAAYPGEIRSADEITFVAAANAIAAFEAVTFRSDHSPFDRFLSGEAEALEAGQHRGADLFYGKANCASCHAGKFQTDHEFHAIAMPQIGPGKADGSDGGYWRASGQRGFVEDYGRGRVTVRVEDNYKFRTPSLRNVAETGPWGHAGCFSKLEDVVAHHLDPLNCLEGFRAPKGLLAPLDQVVELTAKRAELATSWVAGNRMERFALRDSWVQQDPKLRANIAAANELKPVELDPAEVADLISFLHSLTDPSMGKLTKVVPQRVPSGLPVAD
jgi:cytochrome c peroxidase